MGASGKKKRTAWTTKRENPENLDCCRGFEKEKGDQRTHATITPGEKSGVKKNMPGKGLAFTSGDPTKKLKPVFKPGSSNEVYGETRYLRGKVGEKGGTRGFKGRLSLFRNRKTTARGIHKKGVSRNARAQPFPNV